MTNSYQLFFILSSFYSCLLLFNFWFAPFSKLFLPILYAFYLLKLMILLYFRNSICRIPYLQPMKVWNPATKESVYRDTVRVRVILKVGWVERWIFLIWIFIFCESVRERKERVKGIFRESILRAARVFALSTTKFIIDNYDRYLPLWISIRL